MKETQFHIHQEQIDKLKDIGSRLRQFRQAQSLSLEDVASKTRIQARLLKAIEEGRIDILPEPVYVQGFIKRFADAIGLDGEDLASEYPTWPSIFFIKPSWLSLPSAQLRPVHLYFSYILLVFLAVNALSAIVNKSAIHVSNADISEPKLEQPVTKSSQLQASLPDKLHLNHSSSSKPAEITQAMAVSENTTNTEPVRVGVTVKAESWMRVVADGKTEFEGVLQQGDQRTWVAKEQLTVLAGNAGGVLIAFNDEKPKELGEPNKVQKVTFEANEKF
ncbi:MAG TPA: RodZ domain-containing protein [Oculatellaceae cyanobacterium]|jgi:cytoskeletal protein RodZ